MSVHESEFHERILTYHRQHIIKRTCDVTDKIGSHHALFVTTMSRRDITSLFQWRVDTGSESHEPYNLDTSAMITY